MSGTRTFARTEDERWCLHEDIERLHSLYALTGDQQLRAELLARYDGFAVDLARKFPNRRETTEDLTQVARIGLIHAVDRFDPDRGCPFIAFARATILGELKRHVRDRTWTTRIPRSLHDNYLRVMRVADDLVQELGRSPAITDVATQAGMSNEAVLEAMHVSQPASLDAPNGESERFDLGTEDPTFEQVEQRALVRTLVNTLPERERYLLRLRFVDGLTQVEIGRRMGVSQMQVSRALARTLGRLKRAADRVSC